MSSPVATAEDAAEDAPASPRRRDGLRQMVDALITLAFAVILVRAFAVEGYMISTGSMGPTLPGFHKRVTCPACRYEFAVGISDEQDASSAALADDGDPGSSAGQAANGETAVCPNCGQDAIDMSALPRNQGDQLLVFKNAFSFRLPQRWEVAVFRNPSKPTQAYVKRIVGLPGETVRVAEGDVWINGQRVRKPLARQRAVRISVYDHNFEPQNDSNWQPRWTPDTGWRRDGQGFVFSPDGNKAGSAMAWVTYRHWIRSHGVHETRIDIPKGLELEFGLRSIFPVRYDASARQLRHRGVLSDKARDRIASVFENRDFAVLIGELAKRSHLAPVNDDYGYNRVRNGHRPVPVRDLMLACKVTIRGGTGRFAIEITDGAQRYRATIDAGTRSVLLHTNGRKQPLRLGRLKAEVADEPMHIELSLFDRQLLLAVNGHPVFDPVPLESLPAQSDPSRMPVRFGTSGLEVLVDELHLFRDIYYTKKGSHKDSPLGNEEYFVLGDNSPISADSRVWPRPGVSKRLFLGKPFLVHLPSRPGRLRLGGYEMRIRIPDFSRIRYIR